MAQTPATQTRGFLFADLRDYTRFAESHGDAAAAELLARYRMLVRDVIARFEAAEIRTEGDSFYVVFNSASAAVNGGLAILAAAEASSQPGVSPIRVGVGVHAGETADTPEGYVGSAVNIAARICSLAGPGELLVSETVRGLTRTLLGLQFVSRGRRRLKGIAEPIGVYRVMPATGAAGAAAGRDGSRWPLAGWPLATFATVGLAGVLLAVAAVAGILPGLAPSSGDGVPPPGESGSVPSGGAESPSVDAGATSSPALTEAEAALLAKLPAAVREECAPASAAEGSAGGSVSLRCALPLSADADEVWFDQFSTADALARAFADAVALAQAPSGDCRTSAPAHTPWAVPDVHRGSLLCYEAEGAAWLVWTYDDDRILARARRGDDDWQALLAWWRETAIFLR
jgi:class 3 adenylate cyclase